MIEPQPSEIPEPDAEKAIRDFMEQARAAISGTPAGAALDAYARVEPSMPKTFYHSTVKFSTTSNT
ncbi:MAG: hypothetical protein M3T49_01440 [Candidatus Eremiobacteraeota bacterium]|nr:hypothetical protein [Candidatus Eremiobacteraeota bacterium]